LKGERKDDKPVGPGRAVVPGGPLRREEERRVITRRPRMAAARRAIENIME